MAVIFLDLSYDLNTFPCASKWEKCPSCLPRGHKPLESVLEPSNGVSELKEYWEWISSDSCPGSTHCPWGHSRRPTTACPLLLRAWHWSKHGQGCREACLRMLANQKALFEEVSLKQGQGGRRASSKAVHSAVWLFSLVWGRSSPFTPQPLVLSHKIVALDSLNLRFWCFVLVCVGGDTPSGGQSLLLALC